MEPNPIVNRTAQARKAAETGDATRRGSAADEPLAQEMENATLWHRAAVEAVHRNIDRLMQAGLRALAECLTSAKKPAEILREYRAYLEANPERTAAMVAEQREIERRQRVALMECFPSPASAPISTEGAR